MQNMTEEKSLVLYSSSRWFMWKRYCCNQAAAGSGLYGPSGWQCVRAERKDHVRSFPRPQVHYNSSLGQRGNATKSCFQQLHKRGVTLVGAVYEQNIGKSNKNLPAE